MALRRICERSYWASIVIELIIAIAVMVVIGFFVWRVAEATLIAEFFVREVHFYEELVG